MIPRAREGTDKSADDRKRKLRKPARPAGPNWSPSVSLAAVPARLANWAAGPSSFPNRTSSTGPTRAAATTDTRLSRVFFHIRLLKGAFFGPTGASDPFLVVLVGDRSIPCATHSRDIRWWPSATLQLGNIPTDGRLTVGDGQSKMAV